jgi:hypothetical protein
MGALMLRSTGGSRREYFLAAWPIRAVAVSVLLLSFAFSQNTLPKLDLCLFHAITGLQCPGCGLTRAFCAISHGQFTLAWGLNPFSYFFYALALMGAAHPSFANLLPEKATIAITLIITAALVAFGVFRIVAG